MKIVLVSATVGEIQPVLAHLDQHARAISLSEYEYREHRIVPLVTGVGSPATAFALGRFRNFGLDDLILHVGISGSYTPESHREALLRLLRNVGRIWGQKMPMAA